VFGVLHVVQIYGVVTRIQGAFAAVPHVMAVQAAAAVVSGLSLARARGWAPWAAIVTSGLLWITASLWFVFALSNGLFTLFGMLVPGLAALTLVFAFVAKRPCEATAKARERLERQGLELGV
jgi:Na+/proline symporter